MREVIASKPFACKKMVEESREDRISYALDQALHSKPNTKKLSGNEMVHQIFVRFDKDVDFRLNDEEFIDFLKALDPNWKEHIVEIAWEVSYSCSLHLIYVPHYC